MRRFVASLCLLSIFLAACAPTVVLLTQPPPPTAIETSPTPQPATAVPTSTPLPGSQLGVGPDALKGVTVTVWHGLDGTSGTVLTQMASEFSLQNSWGIRVQVVSQGNLNLLEQAVDDSLHGGDPPDVALALPEQALAWDAQQAIIDLSPYVTQTQFGLSADDVKDIPASFWAQSHLQGGRRIGVPAARSARFLFYDQTFADQLGFTTPPQTTDDFRKQACAANVFWRSDKDQTNDGFGGWVVDGDPWTAYSWLLSFDGSVYNDGQPEFVNAQNQAALSFLGHLRADGCAWLSSSPSNFGNLPDHKALFVTGNLADVAEQTRAFAAANSFDEWTVLPFPGQQPFIVVYGPDYVVFHTSTARQLAAWLFIRWMLTPDNQARWATATGFFPVRTSALQSVTQVSPQWKAAAALLPLSKAYPQVASWGLTKQILGDGLFSFFQLNLAPDKASDVLHQMDATASEVVK